jgi:hypothetical protein
MTVPPSDKLQDAQGVKTKYGTTKNP